MSRVSGLTERVRLMILRGEIAPGQWVIEMHLAETFEVSRARVREALWRLEGDGLLVANHDGGMRVVTLDGESLAETLQVRAALEALGAGLAADRVRAGAVGPAAVDALVALADRAQATIGAGDAAGRRGDATAGGPDPAAVLADRDFHRAVDALGANRAAHAALRGVWDRLVVAALQDRYRPRRTAAAANEHRELLAAIRAGDADGAAAVARRHVLA